MRLSNAELADAISVTWERLKTTGATFDYHSAMRAHLDALLSEQARRAEQPEKETDDADH